MVATAWKTLTYAENEVPVILYLKGRPRFKYHDVADPLNASVALTECYPIDMVNEVLNRLSQSLGKPLLNEGLYLPTWKSMEEYLREIAALAQNGSYCFSSKIDGENVKIISR